MNIKDKALYVIEAICIHEATDTLDNRLRKIYKFAHIANGKCTADHSNWIKELYDSYNKLKGNKL